MYFVNERGDQSLTIHSMEHGIGQTARWHGPFKTLEEASLSGRIHADTVYALSACSVGPCGNVRVVDELPDSCPRCLQCHPEPEPEPKPAASRSSVWQRLSDKLWPGT